MIPPLIYQVVLHFISAVESLYKIVQVRFRVSLQSKYRLLYITWKKIIVSSKKKKKKEKKKAKSLAKSAGE